MDALKARLKDLTASVVRAQNPAAKERASFALETALREAWIAGQLLTTDDCHASCTAAKALGIASAKATVDVLIAEKLREGAQHRPEFNRGSRDAMHEVRYRLEKLANEQGGLQSPAEGSGG